MSWNPPGALKASHPFHSTLVVSPSVVPGPTSPARSRSPPARLPRYIIANTLSSLDLALDHTLTRARTSSLDQPINSSPRTPYMDPVILGVIPPHQVRLCSTLCVLATHVLVKCLGTPRSLGPSDTSDAYTPMANGLRLLSDGYEFYEAFSVPPHALCKPQKAPVHHNIEYYPS